MSLRTPWCGGGIVKLPFADPHMSYAEPREILGCLRLCSAVITSHLHAAPRVDETGASFCWVIVGLSVRARGALLAVLAGRMRSQFFDAEPIVNTRKVS